MRILYFFLVACLDEFRGSTCFFVDDNVSLCGVKQTERFHKAWRPDGLYVFAQTGTLVGESISWLDSPPN